MNWPNDADGDVLRRLRSDSFSFDKNHVIDFNIDFSAWPLPGAAFNAIKRLYPNCEIIDPDQEDIENGDLIGYVQLQMVDKVTYELVIETQKLITEQMKEFGGWCESWGVEHG